MGLTGPIASRQVGRADVLTMRIQSFTVTERGVKNYNSYETRNTGRNFS
jgi:acetamidase/formamidase